MTHVFKIQNVAVTDLVKEYGTPLYVYDEKKLKDQCRTYKENFVSSVFDTRVLYASKAFSCIGMLKLIKDTDLCVDVVSMGELYTALKAGIDPKNIYFHGNNKTLAEIQFALDHKVQTFFVDNIMEAKLLVDMMKERDFTLHILLRINPCIEAHTHEFIQTANIDSKFGIDIHLLDDIVELIDVFKLTSNIEFDGFHAHIGSQIFEKEAFELEAKTLFEFVSSLKQRGIHCKKLDLGGGFAVRYTDLDSPIPVSEVCKTLIQACERYQLQFDTDVEMLMIEPGRSIVAEAGSTLYTIGFSKQTPHRHYMFVDGGMSDNIRPSLYQAKYDCFVANRLGEPLNHTVCVAGKCCESGDILIEEIQVSDFKPGDILLVKSTGAYGFSMFNNYNRNTRPAVVFVEDGKSRLVVRKETLEDLLKGDVSV